MRPVLLLAAAMIALFGLRSLLLAAEPPSLHHATSAYPATSTPAARASTPAPRASTPAPEPSPNHGSSTPGPEASTPVARASTPSPGASTPGPGTHGTRAAPRLSTTQWLRGLGRLQAYLETMLARDTGVVTPTLLRSDAGHLLRCSPDLARLGPPGTRLLHAYQLAARACREFSRAAECEIAAARAYDPYSPPSEFTRLLNCSENGSNQGINLIGDAVLAGTGN